MGIAATDSGFRAARDGASEPRWMQVAHVLAGEATDSRTAGRTAAERALSGADPKLAIVFCADTHDVAALAAGVREAVGDTPVMGCTTAGEISARGGGDGGVVVTVLGGDGFRVRTGVGHGSPDELRAAGAEAASCMAELDGASAHRALMLLTEGVRGNKQEAIRGVHDVVGSGVPLVGGCAGDGMRMERSLQIHGADVLSDGVVAAAIESTAPLGMGWSHGWERVGEPMLVTRSVGNRVHEIADRPALDEYLDRLDAPHDVRADPHAFTRWARTHPLGLGRRRNGHEPIGLLAFDCIGRRGVLGEDRIGEEVGEIMRCAGGVPIARLYTYGEIARRKGVNALHSQTFVALAVA